MHQVFCKPSSKAIDVLCPVCRTGFIVFWSRFSPEERQECRRLIESQLRDHHDMTFSSADSNPHPHSGFNVPEWSGIPAYSAAALLNTPGD